MNGENQGTKGFFAGGLVAPVSRTTEVLARPNSLGPPHSGGELRGSAARRGSEPVLSWAAGGALLGVLAAVYVYCNPKLDRICF